MARRATSVDVAADAGVSQATVARTFSSPELVSDATREVVKASSSRLGYVPNAIARSLRSERTNIVGAVVPAHGEHWQSVLTVMSRRLAERGEQLLLFSFDDAEQVSDALDSVAQYRLDGLVLASSTIGAEHLASMSGPEGHVVAFNQPAAAGLLPLVSVDNEAGAGELAAHLASMSGPEGHVVAFNQPAAAGLLPLVSVDNEAGAGELAAHVAGQGARSALFVGGVAAASTDRMRYRGAAAELAERGIPCPYRAAGSFTYDAGYKAAAEILDSREQPDAVMVGSDEVAFGLIDGLRNGGLAVPGDLLVTGFDGLAQAAWAGYDLTTLVQPIDVLVSEALSILLDDESPDGLVSQCGPEEGKGLLPGRLPGRIVSGTLRIGRTTQRR